MSASFFRGKIIEVFSFFGSFFIHGTVPILIELFFQDRKLEIEFVLMLIPAIIIFLLFTRIRTKFKKKVWDIIFIASGIISLIAFVGILLLSFQKIGIADDSIYFKGDHYTDNAKNFKVNNHFNDEELVASVGGNADLVWTDCDSVKTYYFDVLLLGIMVWHIFFSSHLQLKKYERKKKVAHVIE